ncbi:Na+/H+/K+ antiporter P-type ATPase [Colletotrichum higginsianum IMI 349063]|uniref:Na+/H+/K+ antiporter P-type ATPase n=2 Tax=Colletotrichum higginsianum TaxID=80884 RepID=A0A1B7XX68_COLHI|nr:Na+/H+/K+ antiporter P-type ATPase [Colletotrichum higginsianum IMI 349063]OBR04367.1 Na+/H+/K+ antiporter P-type ATPase [Colletotrichum higginsianum IMI 349063]TIC89639.1 Sodium/potassium-transporting ATPase subunit alpha-A [Colletotrichum higginsianum]
MDESEKQQSQTAGERIRWDADEEAGRKAHRSSAGPALHHARSNTSMSIHSIRSRRNSIDAAAELPIQYRTVSIEIEEYKTKSEAIKKAKNVATELSELEWHILSVDEILRRQSSSLADGLSPDQVQRRVAHYGRNAPSPAPTNHTKRILGYFFKGFGTVLLLASVLVFIAWKPLGSPPAVANLALAIVLLAVFFIQAAFNMWQDWSSSRVMNSIKTMLPENCMVIRDGHQAELLADQIVPGDILIVKSGNKLPADVRFLKVSSDAKFDRSILTGESVPLPASVDSTDNNYLETRCIGLQGTHCVSGTCTGLVVATGDNTIFGRIAKLTNEPKKGLTTLEREVLHFVLIICSIMFLMIVIVLIVWGTWLRKQYPNWINVPNLIISCVSVAVAFIPEGLPVALTASMTISANMMRKNKILCKSLKTVETLGSVSVICSDKTGTLTQNKMIVTECAIGTMTMTAEGARDALTLNKHNAPHNNSMEQLRAIAGLCNAGQFDAATMRLPLHERVIHGDATDQAILRFSESLGQVAELRRCWQTKYELAFNSKNKYMIRVLGLSHPDGLSFALPSDTASVFQPGDVLLTIKGAPDVLMPRLSNYINPSGYTTALDPSTRASIEHIKDEWSSQGRRVLLLARKAISRSALKGSPSDSSYEMEINNQAKSGLTLVGLVGIVDPPRPEIPEVMNTLRGAGIRIFMVTGDFALTAQAIAAECNIISVPRSQIDDITALQRVSHVDPSIKPVMDDLESSPRQALVLSGPELMTLNEEQWDQLAQYQEIVFARTTPEQKLRIVRELQARHEIVGMTGDGVNDAPSLRAADVGIALGSGSDIAIEAADMVLLDSFSSVVEALRYGRMMFDNLKKTVAYLLPAGSFSEFWPVMTNVMFGIPQILSSFLMIIICLFTDAAAAIAMAYEAPEADVLLRKPRVPGKDRLVDWQLVVQSYGLVGVLETLSSFAMSYWYLERNGIKFSDIWFSFGNLPSTIDPDYYQQKLNIASSIYFVNLVVMQWFNLMAIRTRRLSLFQHPPVGNRRTQNLYLFPAIAFALLMAIFWLYVPEFQKTLGTAPVPVEYWFLPMTFGLGILLIDEARKFAVRRWPNGILAKSAW